MLTLWERAKPEEKKILLLFLPIGWQSPKTLDIKPKAKGEIESIEEIDRLIRQAPGYYND